MKPSELKHQYKGKGKWYICRLDNRQFWRREPTGGRWVECIDHATPFGSFEYAEAVQDTYFASNGNVVLCFGCDE